MTRLTDVPTPKLAPGDVMLTHGMRVRLAPDPRILDPHPSGLPTWAWDGTVENLPDVLAQGVVPASYLIRYAPDGTVTARDGWTVQGNRLATWTVEREDA